MSSARCGHCGARSTIWLSNCAFCGHQIAPFPVSGARIREAVFDEPAGPRTERRRRAKKGSRFEGLRLLASRLRRRLAFIRP
jgi:hypothetical protein